MTWQTDYDNIFGSKHYQVCVGKKCSCHKEVKAFIQDLLDRKAEEKARGFEYLVINHTSWISEEKDRMNGNWFQDRLDKYGVDGWELCAVDNTHAYFKKALDQALSILKE